MLGEDLVGVITVNWNRAELTAACLRAAMSGLHPPIVAAVADNGSDVDPSPLLRSVVPAVSVVRLGANRGYAAGCNAAAAAVVAQGARHLLFLNNDAFVEPGAIAALLDAIRAHPGSILAPKVVFADAPDRVWSAGGLVRGPWLENWHIGEGDPAADHDTARSVDWATGCALFVSVETWEQVGPFDESLFLYLEDVEWCLRAARRGVPIRYVPEAVVRHELSATASQLPRPEVLYYGCRNTHQVAIRYARLPRRVLLAAVLVWSLAKVGVRLVLSPNRRGDVGYRARGRALFDALAGRSGPMPTQGWLA